MMVEVAPNTYKMDEYVKDIIQAVYSACNTANARLKDDPAAADNAIKDCEEMLGVVMEGNIQEWVQ